MNRLLLAAAASAVATLLAGPAAATGWPKQPITMLIGYGAGGGTTVKGRVLANILSKELGQKINILNKPGGGQSVALMQFKSEKPDGNMFFYGALTGITMQPQLNKAITYTVDDFVLAGGITEFQPALIAPAGSPYKTLKEFVAWAKKADRVKFAALSPGAKMTMQVIAAQEGLKNIDYVPTRGGQEMIQLVISKQVDFAYSGGLHAKYPGKAITFAAVASKRLKTEPEVPTLRELGYDVVSDAPTIIAFPKGIDPAIVKKMEAALKVAETHPDMIKISKAVSYPINYMTAAEAQQAAQDSWKAIAKMIKDTGYQAQ